MCKITTDINLTCFIYQKFYRAKEFYLEVHQLGFFNVVLLISAVWWP